MLRLLRVRNLALVEDLTWEPGPGFTVMTGETGAGKSIVVGALSLVLGDRADKSLIRTGADGCTVEAEWELGDGALLAGVAEALERCGAEPCEDRVLRLKRSVSAAGQNRQFLNGSPVTLQVLREIGGRLGDFHGPHDHQSLLSTETQRELLDAYAGAGGAAAEVRGAWQEAQRLETALREIEAETAASEREVQLLAFQVDEIEKAGLAPGEDVEIGTRMEAAHNFRRLSELTGLLAAQLEGEEDSLTDRVAAVERNLSELVALDKRAAGMEELLETARTSLNELGRELGHYTSGLEVDPAELARIEERYNLLAGLKRKHGPSLAEVIRRGEEGRARLNRMENREEELKKAREAAAGARLAFQKQAEALSKARGAAAGRLGKAITAELRDLGFEKAVLEVRVGRLEAAGPHGLDAVEFQFAPNVGEGAKPLRSIASSGEMARVMLAIKGVLAAQDTVPLLVFDEVDANVGGETGTKVGRKLRGLGAARQVLCVTHLPQVAALGAAHYQVSKATKGERTFTQLDLLDGEGRVEELARMLGGANASSRDLARAMLGGC